MILVEQERRQAELVARALAVTGSGVRQLQIRWDVTAGEAARITMAKAIIELRETLVGSWWAMLKWKCLVTRVDRILPHPAMVAPTHSHATHPSCARLAPADRVGIGSANRCAGRGGRP